MSDAERPEMIISADRKNCRAVSCMKAKAGKVVVERPLCERLHCKSGDANVKYSKFNYA